MKSSQLLNSVILFIGVLMCLPAAAQVYKCTTVDKQSNKSQTIYTDAPCPEHVKQILIDVEPSQGSVPNKPAESSLDTKVTRAVLEKNFKLAKSLAVTKEHWRLISMAEGSHQSSVTTAPATSKQVVVRDECAIARNAYELTARTQRRNKKLIAAKKNSMFAACGVAEPAEEASTVIIGNQLGRGIQRRRWIGTPYGRVFNRPRLNRPQYVNRGAGLSILYQNKHGGVRVQNGGVQNNTNIRQQFRTKNFAGEQQGGDIRKQFR
jgi:hypothetical protein